VQVDLGWKENPSRVISLRLVQPVLDIALIQKHAGGLDMEEKDLAVVLTAYGVMLMAYSAWGYPRMQQVCTSGNSQIAGRYALSANSLESTQIHSKST